MSADGKTLDVEQTVANEQANLKMMEEINEARRTAGLTQTTLEIDPSSHADGQDHKIHPGEVDLVRKRDKSLGEWDDFNKNADFFLGLKGYDGRLFVRP
jgi:hypothetical protein